MSTNTTMAPGIDIRTGTESARLDDSVLPLFVWLSPGFPVGSFAYSHGLEWVIDAGDITDAVTCEAWIGDLLRHGSARSDAVLLACAYRAVARGDRSALSEAAELAAALAPSRERRLETLNQGEAFLAAVRVAWPAEEITRLAHGRRLAFPVTVGVAAAAHGLPLLPTLEAYVIAFVSNLVSVAVRLVPLGQTEAAKVVAGLAPVTREVARHAVDATLEDVGGAGFRSDIASMRHETQSTRLFRS